MHSAPFCKSMAQTYLKTCKGFVAPNDPLKINTALKPRGAERDYVDYVGRDQNALIVQCELRSSLSHKTYVPKPLPCNKQTMTCTL